MRMQRFLDWLRYDAARWMFFQTSDFAGLRILTYDEADPVCSAKTIAALQLIAQLDPRTFTVIQRYLTGGIAVEFPQSSEGWYLSDRKICCLSHDYVEAVSSEEVALLIIHEVCHARLMHSGIGYEEHLRFRVEQACIRRELAFARLIERHNGSDCVAAVKARLDGLSEAQYSDAAFRWRQRQNQLLELRYLRSAQAPKCLRWFAVINVRRRWRKENARSRKDL